MGNIDIASCSFEIEALLDRDGHWPKFGEIKILMGLSGLVHGVNGPLDNLQPRLPGGSPRWWQSEMAARGYGVGFANLTRMSGTRSAL